MSVVAIITARGGSKRIPRKNIKDFMGKPMLAYAIEAAKKTGIFDEIMVSTEDAEIAQVAQNFGAKVPFMRSPQTASDFATTMDVLKEVYQEYIKRGVHFDEICCIYPCVPLLTPDVLKEAYESFKNSEGDSLTPVVQFSYPIQRALQINQQGFLEYREPESAAKRSQDLRKMYHDVGMFYYMKASVLGGGENKAAYFEMKESQIQDIDTLEDWNMAELKYRMLHNA